MDDLDALAGLLIDSATGGEGGGMLPGIYDGQQRDLERGGDDLLGVVDSSDVAAGSVNLPPVNSMPLMHVVKSVSTLLTAQPQSSTTRRRRPPVTSTFALAVNHYLVHHPAFALSQSATLLLQQTSLDFKDLLEDAEGELVVDTVMDVQRHRVWIGSVQEALEVERLSAVYTDAGAALEALLEPLQELAAGSVSPSPVHFDMCDNSRLSHTVISGGQGQPDICLTAPSGLSAALLRNTLGRAAYYVLKGPLFAPKQQLPLGFMECSVRPRIDELPTIVEVGAVDESTERTVIRRTLGTASTSKTWQVAAESISRDVYDRAAWHTMLDCIGEMPIHTVRHIWQAFCFYFPTCGPYITAYARREMSELQGSGCSTRIGQGNVKLANENGIRDGEDRDEAEAKFRAILRVANLFSRHLVRCRCTALFEAYFTFIHEFIPLPDGPLDACYRATLVDLVGNHPSSTPLWLEYIAWGGRKVGPANSTQWTRKLYHRVLSIPLEDRDRVAELYRSFEESKLHGGSFRLDDELEKKFKRAENSRTELGPLWERVSLGEFQPCSFANTEVVIQAQCRYGRLDAPEMVTNTSYAAEADDHSTKQDLDMLEDPFRRPYLAVPPGHSATQSTTWSGFPGARSTPHPFSLQEDAEVWLAWDTLLTEELPHEKGGAHFSFFSRELYASRCIEVLWKRVGCFPFHVESWLDLVKFILSATALPLKVQEREARRVLEAAREVLPDSTLLICEFADYMRRGRELADDVRGHELFYTLTERIVKRISIFQQSVPLVTDLGKEFVVWRAAMRLLHVELQGLSLGSTPEQRAAVAARLKESVQALGQEFDACPGDMIGVLSESDWIEHSRNILVARQQAALSIALFKSLTSVFAQWMQWARQAYGVEEGAFHVRMVARHAIKGANLLAAVTGEVKRLYKAFCVPLQAGSNIGDSRDDIRSVWRAVRLDGVCSIPSANQQLSTNPTSFEGLTNPQPCPLVPLRGAADLARELVSGAAPADTASLGYDLRVLFQGELEGASGVGEHDGDRDDAADRPVVFSPKHHLALFGAYCNTWATLEACFSQSPPAAMGVIDGWFQTIKRLFVSTRDKGWTAMECGIDRNLFSACHEAWATAPSSLGEPLRNLLSELLELLRADQHVDSSVEQRWCVSLLHTLHVAGHNCQQGVIEDAVTTLREALSALQDRGSLSAEEVSEMEQVVSTSRNVIKKSAAVDPMGAILAFLDAPASEDGPGDSNERLRLYAAMWSGGVGGDAVGGSEAFSPVNASSFSHEVLHGRKLYAPEDASGVSRTASLLQCAPCQRPTPHCMQRDAVAAYQSAVDRSLTGTALTPFSRVDHSIVVKAKASLVNAHYNRTAATAVDQQRELLLASPVSDLRQSAALQTSRHGIKYPLTWYQGGHHRSIGWPARLHDRLLQEEALYPTATASERLASLRRLMEDDPPRTELYKDRSFEGGLSGGRVGMAERSYGAESTFEELITEYKLSPSAAVAGVEDLLGHTIRSIDPANPASGNQATNAAVSTHWMQFEMLKGTLSLLAADELIAQGKPVSVGRSVSSTVNSHVHKAELMTMLPGANVFNPTNLDDAGDSSHHVHPHGQWADFDLPVNERLQARQKKLLRQQTARGRGGGDRGGGGRGRGLGLQTGLARGQSLLALANEEEHMRIKSRSKHLRKKVSQGKNDFEDVLLSSSDSSSPSESDSERDDEFVLQQVALMLGYDALSLASDATASGDVPMFSRHHVSTSSTSGMCSFDYALDSVSLLLATKQEEVEREDQAARAKVREQRKRVVDRDDFVELGAEVRKVVPQLVSDTGMTLDSHNWNGDFNKGNGIFYAPRDTASAQEALRSKAERTVARSIAKDLEAGKRSPDQATIASMIAETLQKLQDQAAEEELLEKQQERMSRGRGRGGRGRGGQGDAGGGYMGRGGGGRAAGKASLTTAGRMRRRVAEGITTKDYPSCDVWVPLYVSADQLNEDEGFYIEASKLAEDVATTLPIPVGGKRPRDEDEGDEPPTTAASDSFGKVTSVAPTRLNADSSDVNGLRGNTALSPVHFLASMLPLHTYEDDLVSDTLATSAAVKLVSGSGRGIKLPGRNGAGWGGSDAASVTEDNIHSSEAARLRTDVLVTILRDSQSFLVSTTNEAEASL